MLDKLINLSISCGTAEEKLWLIFWKSLIFLNV